jgi:GT2 family glycosyltransferase
VAVVIGNFNGEPYLADCIASLRAQEPVPAEILVVDGASTDGGVTLAQRLDARVVERPNLGLGHLYNVGLATTSAPYVFLANNDIALEDGCLRQLSEVLDRDDMAFAVDARQLDWSGGRTIHARTTLTRGGMTREYLPGLHLDPNVPAAEVTPTVCANGAAMMVRRSMFEALGGFDETFFMEWEDLDLCWRAWLRGWPTLYVPNAVVRHRVGAVTTSDLGPRRSASSHHNLVRFALKCLPRNAVTRVLVGELLRLPRHPRAVTLGLVSVARELPAILRDRGRIKRKADVLEAMTAVSR